MKVSVLIPCFNEIGTIGELLDRVRESGVTDKEIIPVDYCSSDGSREWLQAEADRLGIRLLLHEVNQGKGAALRTGMQHANGDVLLHRQVQPLSMKMSVGPG